MTSSPSPGPMAPGFDFLMGLMKGASPATPGTGSWVTPTLDPDELGKRIDDLRTVQFWLEQNVRMLATSIQALEVQRMTLSTLKSMNLSMGDIGKALTIPLREPAAPAERPSAKPARPEPEPAPAPDAGPAAADAAAPSGQPAVDPMQWWGALTQQFTEIAARAVGNAGPGAAPPEPADAGPGSQARAAASGAPAGKPASAPARAAARKPKAPRR